MLIRGAEVEGCKVDVRLADEQVTEIANALPPRAGEEIYDANGGALLPGLHDHHIHLLALAAAHASTGCGPPSVVDRSSLQAAIKNATVNSDGWIRGIGYDDSVAGPLERTGLDALCSTVPIRIQHRSGALWIVNSLAADALRLDEADTPPGVEKDYRGRATGRLFRLDAWMRSRLPPPSPPNLAPVGQLLARFGVTGVTDATPTTGTEELALLSAAARSGALPQRVTVMGHLDTPVPSEPTFSRGAVKILLDEPTLPPFDALCEQIDKAHRGGRAVAVHCVTTAVLVFTLAAFREAGSRGGDRIEHASVAPPDTLPLLRSLGITVVTQPNFIAERGDRYRVEVEPGDRPWLYRVAGLLDEGIPVGGGTDAPYGTANPWIAIRAAVERATASGATLGRNERVSPERALALFLTPWENPGGSPKRVTPGIPGDLCLLRRPWAVCRLSLDATDVAATWIGGRLVHDASPHG